MIDSTSLLPLVVALHGCTQDAGELLAITGWDKLADARGFYLLCPQQRASNNLSHCFNWFRAKDAHGAAGEAASIMNMIEQARTRWKIDPKRVYIYGVSAGAAMAVDLMSGNPGIFSAGAVIAGGPFLGDVGAIGGMKAMIHPPDRSPEEWRSIITSTFPSANGPWPRLVVMCGTDDRLVDPRASEELIKQWAGVHATDAEPDSVEQSVDGHSDIERRSYRDQHGNVVITSFRFEHLGHAIAIDPGDGPCQGGKITHLSVDLDFHSTCAAANCFGL